MNCLEFKRLALSDPNTDNPSFIEHSEACPDCLKYLGGVHQMDSKLADSLDIEIPDSLTARLELNQILTEDQSEPRKLHMYAMAASIAALFVVGGLFLKGQFLSSSYEQHDVAYDQRNDVADSIVMQMINHIESKPVTPVWGADQANQTMKVLLASYDSSIKLKEMARLQFSIICPMGKHTKALHANLETDHGQITFAYIKGSSVGEVKNTSYKGYVTRLKPIRGGNLLIISRNMPAMEDADSELESAIYWDI